jgi:hypothetical protein
MHSRCFGDDNHSRSVLIEPMNYPWAIGYANRELLLTNVEYNRVC